MANVSIENEKKVTVDDIVAEADSIYRECKMIKQGKKHIDDCCKKTNYRKGTPIDEMEYDKIDKLHNKIYEHHKDFATAYPMVLRHITQQQKYSTKAFRKYLEHIGFNPWKNDEDRINSYCIYYKMLLMDTLQRYSATFLNQEVERYRKMLTAEHEEFIKNTELASKQVESNEKRYAKERKQEMIKALRKIVEEEQRVAKGVAKEDAAKEVSTNDNSTKVS